MKTAIVSITLLTLSFVAHANVSKETWTCHLGKDGKDLTAVFTKDSTSAKLLQGFTHTGEDVVLTFAKKNQKSALTGSERTMLKGYSAPDHDSYSYEVTLIRTNMEDYEWGDKGKFEAPGQAIVITNADEDCRGHGVGVVTLDCKVEVEH